MPVAVKKPCAHGQCPALVNRPDRYCPKHAPKEKQRQYEAKKQDPVWMMYHTTEWKKFRAWFLRLNPLCMRVIDGQQCCRIATLVHHRISPRKRPDLFRCADNVKSLCAEHHAPTEGDVGDEVYTESDTKYSLEESTHDVDAI